MKGGADTDTRHPAPGTRHPAAGGRGVLFSVTLFLSAALLFWVQPLVGKMLLPLLGGTPSVWNTCLLFFQAALLGGYAYALASTRWLAWRWQVALHALLFAAAALALPLAVSWEAGGAAPGEDESPAFWLLKKLLVTVGPPFFVLSSTAPLLQKWFTRTRAASASDPYFLYAASNAGSLAALLGFPLLLEPSWPLGVQGRAWSLGYAGLAVLLVACAWAARRTVDEREVAEVSGGEGGALSLRRRLRWALLAFVPSSLVLGATTYITTDVAAVPLLWVVPLSLYLLSFVLVFAHRRLVPSWLAARMLPGSAVLLALVYLSGATQPAWFLVLFHLLFLFAAALVCHGLLADDRPHARHLAEFYLWLSAGGAAGGLFNALLAPLVFDTVIEYPLVVVLACYLGPAFQSNWFGVLRPKTRAREGADVKEEEGAAEAGGERSFARVMWTEAALPLSLFVLAGALGLVAPGLGLETVERTALALGVPLFLLNHFGSGRPSRFALGLAAVMLASTLAGERPARTLHAERNFFGTLRVNANSDDSAHSFQHGSTLHGRQYTDPARACEPLSYYHRRGPLGTVFEEYGRRQAEGRGGVAVVGLGAGASAAYARAGEDWTFYEIDPAVARLARDPAFFTYLTKCANAAPRVVIGDARLRLREAPDAAYGLVVLDAFSSDAVPAHLLTREALDLYLSKLAPGGLVVFHTSNRSLELDRVAGGLARDAGLVARIFTDTNYDSEDARDPSEWVVVARRAEDLGRLADDARWAPLDQTTRKLEVWRDDFSNVASVIKWQ